VMAYYSILPADGLVFREWARLMHGKSDRLGADAMIAATALSYAVPLVTRNAAGQTQQVVGNYRPRSTLLVLSRLLGEKFAGTPIGEHFLASDSLEPVDKGPHATVVAGQRSPPHRGSGAWPVS